jgi:hypothetical protein
MHADARGDELTQLALEARAAARAVDAERLLKVAAELERWAEAVKHPGGARAAARAAKSELERLRCLCALLLEGVGGHGSTEPAAYRPSGAAPRSESLGALVRSCG